MGGINGVFDTSLLSLVVKYSFSKQTFTFLNIWMLMFNQGQPYIMIPDDFTGERDTSRQQIVNT